MRKETLTLLLLVVMAAGKIKIGLSGGITTSSLWGEKGSLLTKGCYNIYGYDSVLDIEKVVLTKPFVGLTLEIPLTPKSSLVTELNLLKKGFEEEKNVGGGYGSFIHFEEFTQRWLELPVLFRYRLYQFRRFNISAEAGAWFAWLLSSEEYKLAYDDWRLTEVPKEDSEKIYSSPSNIDTGFRIGFPLSFDVGSKIQLYVNPAFSLGLISQIAYEPLSHIIHPDPENTDVIDTVYLTGGENKFYDFRIQGGVSFALGKR